jgi:hypothetical protein
MSYVSRHKNEDFSGRRCWVRLPYEGIFTGTIDNVRTGPCSSSVTVRLDGQTERSYFQPEIVFLSEPVEVRITDIFGTCHVWQESALAFRS